MNDSKKCFLKLMNNAVFGKTMESFRKHRDFNLVTNESRRNCLVSESNYHTTIFFLNIFSNGNEKTHILVEKESNYVTRTQTAL